jgi:small subunit ribosomal protein S2
MKDITLEELLEAGCHFGHQVTRSNPKARDFVFESRDNIQIIDLVKTKTGLDEAAEYVKQIAQRGGTILVVATKRQAQPILDEELKRIKELLEDNKKGSSDSIYYITNKWIGGILTNFSEVSKNFKKLNDLKELVNSQEKRAIYTKKEIGLMDKEIQRLEVLYGGIAKMLQKPDVMFVVDSHLEYLAVSEAKSMGVATVAIVDTNADPSIIDYPIPANDDAVGSIKLISSHILDAWTEGVKSQKPPKVEGESPEEPKKETEPKAKIQKKEEKTVKAKIV